jgi:aarF domain-containing kinase
MPVMLKNRLKAPPPEVYSLHRKLSGAYLMNMNLTSEIDSRKIFMDAYKRAKANKKYTQSSECE